MQASKRLYVKISHEHRAVCVEQLLGMWSEIPAHWDKCEIGKICAVIGGGTPSRAISAYFGGDIVWMTPTQIDKTKIKTVCSSNERITKQGLDNSAAKIIPKGAILLTTRASIGYVAIAGCKLTTNQGFKSLVCESRVHNYYLAHWLAANKTLLNTISTGTTFKEVSTRAIRKLIIPLPPIRQQHIIARKIESIFAEIDSAMTVFQDNGAESIEFKLDRLRRSILSKEVSPSVQKTHRKVKSHNTNWENIILSKLAHINTSNTLQHVNQKSLIHIGLEHILSNLNKIKGYSDTQNVKTYRLFQKGDILYGRLRPNLNKVWLATTNGHCSTDILPLTANPTKILPQFLLYVMSSHQFVQKATMGSSGVGMPRIRWNVLQDFVLAVPPLAEQRTIVKKIESIFAKIDAEKQKFAKLHAQRQTYFEQLTKLRQSVLRQAFTGKLV